MGKSVWNIATRIGVAAVIVAGVSACASSHARAPAFATTIASGEATYYADSFAGRPTASGEAYDPGKLTAAHRTLPFGTRVRVTDVASGDSVVVRINDRGPWGNKGRVIDISRAAASEIGLLRRGRSQVALSLASNN